ncbi:MAG: hypothetical protein IJZ29_02560 [Clostridia bacterium]|nr:hypothetical protein [Clostridia bacterium]
MKNLNAINKLDLKNKPVYINGDVVLVNEEEYNYLLKRSQELKLIEEIEKGEEDYKNGRVMSLAELKDKLGIK